MPNERVTFLCYHIIKSERLSSFSVTIQAIQACYKVRTTCFGEFMPIQGTSMVHTNIHYAHQSILHSTYKHSFSHQNISCGKYKHSFSYHNILHCTHKTFSLQDSIES